MNVNVYAGYWARRWLGADEVTVTSGSNISALDAALKAGIPEDEIGPLELGGKIIPPEHEPADGETVRVYAKIIGG